MKTNIILQGDVIEKLKEIPDEFVDCIITSPPYYGLRDYGVKGQIGLEKTLDEYLNKMLEVTKELKRVLKKTGTMWWNHGDSYAGASSYDPSGRQGYAKGKTHTREKTKGYQEKCLLLQAHRLVIKMIDDESDDEYELRSDAPKWVLQELKKRGIM